MKKYRSRNVCEQMVDRTLHGTYRSLKISCPKYDGFSCCAVWARFFSFVSNSSLLGLGVCGADTSFSVVYVSRTPPG